MRYLMIQNKGVSSPEAILLLGASTTRYAGSGGTVGYFGSGSKHAVATLLRDGIKPIMYLGNLGIEFDTERTNVRDGLNDREFDVICYKMKGKDLDGKSVNRTERSSVTTDFGQADWCVANAVREFVANALDRSLREHEVAETLDGNNYIDDVLIEAVNENQVRAKAGYTRVFLPMHDSIEQYHKEIGKRFLHFSEPWMIGKTILPKRHRNIRDENESAVIYSNGVYVREIRSGDMPSLFDYNFTRDQLKLDESRNVDDYAVHSAVARVMKDADVNTLVKVFKSFEEDKRLYEIESVSDYELNNTFYDSDEVTQKRKETWNEAWRITHGEEAVACNNTPLIKERIKRKGYRPVMIPSEKWLKAISRNEVPEVATILSADDREGRSVSDATPVVRESLDEIWGLLEKLDLLNGREKPPVHCFSEIMSAESMRLGFYRQDAVFIHDDISGNGSFMLSQTTLEELSHHITGATDNSRDFQDYLLRAFIKLAIDTGRIKL